MENWAFIRLMSICYLVAGALLTVGIQVTLRGRVKESERKDFYVLVLLLVPLGTFCLWLLWICMYMAQMNPMISPIKHVHEPAAEAVKLPA
ncbi:hypothetical protein BBBOND_0303250 [Babesia bigemina]|uniref:Uncharacterized protein n=1 Tax=Babesia bigemina TaxID=5866 RepID=A0A061D6U7_BABBI|nr:hypothetical protein BBBOND_0303250 [Babesia bigemina]CDR96421.1 hypothetical protein BBBOND_0303250 [Babesia bigemina]|eukprot:XP_012768607.1 hypothetical protein BBBOND_0303250 [Babesia bigemina]